MEEQFLNKRLDELWQLTQDPDLARATRRMLDVGTDLFLSRDLETKILNIRKKYNSLSEESVDHNPDSYQEQMNNLRAEIELVCTEVKEKSKVPAQPSVINKVMLTTEGLGKVYEGKGRTFRFEPLTLELKTGEITGVVGENGNGKTTLLRMLAGDLASTSGTINFPQYHTNEWYEAKQKIGYIPQRIDTWFGTLSDNLKFTASIHGIKDEENDYAVDYIIERLGLNKFRDLTWKQISGGYRLRFELAKVLIRKPQLLILDEPLANLDINAQQLFLQDLKYLSQSIRHPFAVILSSQQLHEVENISDNLIFIKNGNTLYSGARRDFGKDRSTNCIELNGQFEKQELIAAIKDMEGATVEETGTIYIVNFAVNIAPVELLKTLLSKGLMVNYYRDISDSTRKLFKKDM
ncbi:MAG: ABC transporter ATP-binding protein [Bacteroidota bacterium]|nr:ABC transporter ATP-binding protein [Bacteroidota bacterium]